MTTDAPTATNPTTTDTDTAGAEERADTEAMASSRGKADDLPDAFKPVDEQRGLADLPVPNNTEECRLGYAFGYADALEGVDAASLFRERNRLRAALERIESWQLPAATDRHGNPSPFEIQYGSDGAKQYIRQIAREALQGSDTQ